MDGITQRATIPTPRIIANPNLWSQFVGEIFKWRRHLLYQWFVGAPFIFATVAALGMLLSPARPDYSGIDSQVVGVVGMAGAPIYALGSVGAFAIAGQIMISGFLPMFAVGFALLAGWCVYSEFNWRTIKMVASRQPNRAYVVLSKVLFVAVMACTSFVTITLSWLLLAMFFKVLFGAPFGLTPQDVEVIGLNATHLALRCLAMFLWALPTMAAVYSVKAVTGGVVIYLVYSGIDGLLSTLGATATNMPQAYMSAESFYQTIIEIARNAYPYLLTSHLNRLTMLPTSPQVVASLPMGGSWVAVGLYVIAFVALALLIFVPRDIKE
ncbi:MAG: ABC transporter permease [Anaerolineae bacterium]|nr:ABC transporter permease [Anaerolineae bacterium]